MTRHRWLVETGAVALGLVFGLLVGLAVPPVGVLAPTPTPPDSTWFDTLDLSKQRDSIVAYAARVHGVPVRLAIAVSHTENWSGDSTAESSVGAIGLMQVMPRYWQHSFEAECGCGSLFDRRRNACKGVLVLKHYLDSLPTVDLALRSYHGSNKPRLHAAGDGYVATVLERLIVPRDGTSTVLP